MKEKIIWDDEPEEPPEWLTNPYKEGGGRDIDSSLCELENCTEEASTLVYEHETKRCLLMCDKHLTGFICDGKFKHLINCPNCNCIIGVP